MSVPESISPEHGGEQQPSEVPEETVSAVEDANPGLIEKALRRNTERLPVKVEDPEVEPSGQLTLVRDPYDPRSEKIRALRTELLMLSDAASVNLAIVSSAAGEGRSLLAAELALAFGQLGRRTLLVDADMRNPTQHSLFQTSNKAGLAQCIAGRTPQMYRIKRLTSTSLITAGTATSNPLELLSDQRFERLMERWRKQFEFIILDTPPINRFADGLTVAALAGRVLVVSRAEATRFKDLKETLRRLSLTRSQILGAVINSF
jgi:capsular exopolysaccharide synthesis family protein